MLNLRYASLAAASGVLAMAGLLAAGRLPWAAESWQDRLTSMSDPQAVQAIAELDQSQEATLGLLSELLDSARPALARAARQSIGRQVRSAASEPPEAAAARLTVLSEAMAARMEGYGPQGREAARGLSREILLNLPAEGASGRRVVNACEKVLRSHAGLEGQPKRPAETVTVVSPRPYPARPNGALVSNSETSAIFAPPEDLIGGGLEVALNDTAADAVELEAGAVRADEDRGGEHSRSTVDARAPTELGPVSARPLDEPSANDPPADDADQARTSNRPASTSDAARESAAPERLLAQMQALQGETAAGRDAAEAALVGQGFDATHLEIARRLTSPDPLVRKRLAEQLPRMPGVDAGPWLTRLIQDKHPEVRLAALSIMATTGDPAMLRQVEQTARQDSDPRVQAQGARMLLHR